MTTDMTICSTLGYGRVMRMRGIVYRGQSYELMIKGLMKLGRSDEIDPEIDAETKERS